jgi:hypothetical protein
MYRIVGKDNLEAVNSLANEAIMALHELKDNANDYVSINKLLVQRLAQGYLYMYNKSIEHSIMPNNKDKNKFFDEFIN